MRISIGGTRKLYSNKDIMFERILKKETRFFQQMESRCRWKKQRKENPSVALVPFIPR